MKTWNGEVRLAPHAMLPRAKMALVVRNPISATVAIVTPAQAMRLANQLRRWAMGKLRPRDEALPSQVTCAGPPHLTR